MIWPPWLALTVLWLLMAMLSLTLIGAGRWTLSERRRLVALRASRHCMTAQHKTVTHYDLSELEGLPAPVQRYFRAALTDGQPVVTAVRIQQVGSINMSATGEQWMSFTARQHVTTQSPGFLWDAKVSWWADATVRVVDGYVAGNGLLHAAILGLVPVANTSGGGEIARGEFMRFFAEAPWYPTALLPSQGVRWAAVDSHSARATLVDGTLELTVLFRFHENDLVASVRAEARGGLVGKRIVMKPWECSLSQYKRRNGMMVPLMGEAAWVEPAGPKAYFVGQVTELSYEFAA